VTSTPVPAVDRAIAILRALAAEPQRTLTLTEAARLTGVHKATCAALLSRLETHGLVVRDAAKRYALGPGALALAWSYTQRFAGLPAARAEMFRLASRFNLGSSVYAADLDELVVIDCAGNVRPRHLPTQIGRRIPLTPPIGTLFKAWSPAAELRAWLTQMAEQYEVDEQEQRRVVSFIRSHGYAARHEQDLDVRLETVLRSLADEALDNRTASSALETVLRSLADQTLDNRTASVALMAAEKLRDSRETASEGARAADRIDYVSAPVFDPAGRVTMSINLFGEPGQILPSQVEELAGEVVKSARIVTDAIHGSRPGLEG
jgi:DNA-binding IclR family transcriptional regulator